MKKWLFSRTLWVNVAAGAAVLIQYYVGERVIPVEYQVIALAVANFLLRFRTNQPIGR